MRLGSVINGSCEGRRLVFLLCYFVLKPIEIMTYKEWYGDQGSGWREFAERGQQPVGELGWPAF